MPRRKSASGGTCPVARSVAVIGDRWSLLVLRDVFDGIHRFGDIQRNLGVARNILSDRLGHLVEEGILATRPASDGTAYQEYLLTAKGEHLFPVVVALQQWGERYLFGRGERHSTLVDKRTGRPIPFMAPTAKGSTVLMPSATEVRQK